jgi:putative endonuclease
MAAVYILYSKEIDSYYIGSCKEIDERLLEHARKKFKTSFTTRADDWSIFLKIDGLDYHQARDIEAHIKKMKSRKYLQNLILFPEIIDKLIRRF